MKDRNGGRICEDAMISYATNREDVLLNRALGEREQGFYVDVGANDPIGSSNTKAFYDRGWQGINIEPGQIFNRLRAQRPRDVNLNVAVSSSCGTITLHEFPFHGLSRISADFPPSIAPFAAGAFPRPVPSRTLGDILAEHAEDRTIDFMTIDVEEHEREVLVGNDWSRFRPRVLVIDAVLPNTQVCCHDRWEALLLEADYLFAHFDGLNRWYVRAEDAELLDRLAAPVNVYDDYIDAEHKACLDRLERFDELTRVMGPRSLKLLLGTARSISRFKQLVKNNVLVSSLALRTPRWGNGK